MRESLFMREPLCRLCKAQGIVRIATERDHVIPLSEGGRDDQTNEQPLCVDHHREKTLAEALRARARG